MSMIKPKAVHFYMSIEEKQKLDDYARKVDKSQAQILREYINTLDTETAKTFVV